MCTDNNPLTYFLTLPNMDAMKQRWINKLVKYNFSLEYQKGKNNTVADALSQIQEKRLSDQEADKLLKDVPIIPGEETIRKIFEEKGGDQDPESPAQYAMSSAAMKGEWKVLFLINSGGQASMMMSIKPFKGENNVKSTGERRRKLPWYP